MTPNCLQSMGGGGLVLLLGNAGKFGYKAPCRCFLVDAAAPLALPDPVPHQQLTRPHRPPLSPSRHSTHTYLSTLFPSALGAQRHIVPPTGAVKAVLPRFECCCRAGKGWVEGWAVELSSCPPELTWTKQVGPQKLRLEKQRPDGPARLAIRLHVQHRCCIHPCGRGPQVAEP